MDDNTLKKIFELLQNENYCVVKLDESSLGKKGGDIDIYCNNISRVGKKILQVGNILLEKNIYDDIKLIEDKNLKHVYIDFYNKDKIDFRFDLYGKFPYFRTIGVKKELFEHCLINKKKKIINNGENSYPIFIPEENFDLLIRYIEFIEGYPEREDKIKHLKYISDYLDNNEKRFSFFKLLTTYVLKRTLEKKKRIYLSYVLINLIKRIFKKIKRIISNY